RINEKSLSFSKIESGNNDPIAYFLHLSSEDSKLDVLNKIYKADKHFQYIVISSSGEIYQLGDNFDLTYVEDRSTKVELQEGRKKVTLINDMVLTIDSLQYHFI